MRTRKKRITLALLVLTLGAFLSSCAGINTYEVTKKDNTKERLEASYFQVQGNYVHFYAHGKGWVRTVQANEIKPIK